MQRLKRSIWQYEVRRSRVLFANEAQPIYAAAVTNADTVAAIFRNVVGEQPREHLLAFYLNGASHVMGYETTDEEIVRQVENLTSKEVILMLCSLVDLHGRTT